MNTYDNEKAQVAPAKAQESNWIFGCGSSLQGDGGLGSQATAGDLTGYGNIPAPVEHVCPCCGYCPYCGRGGGYVPNYPPPIEGNENKSY